MSSTNRLWGPFMRRAEFLKQSRCIFGTTEHALTKSLNSAGLKRFDSSSPVVAAPLLDALAILVLLGTGFADLVVAGVAPAAVTREWTHDAVSLIG